MKKPAEPWFVRAEDDLRFAKLGLDHQYYSQVCFLAQQAAEKSLKALLIARKGAYPRLHNLVGLMTANVCRVFRRFQNSNRTLAYWISIIFPVVIQMACRVCCRIDCRQKSTPERLWILPEASLNFVLIWFLKRRMNREEICCDNSLCLRVSAREK